jgi:hypothetical protein
MLSSLLRPSRRSSRQGNGPSPFTSPSPRPPRRDPPNECSQLLPPSANNEGTDGHLSGVQDDEASNTEDEELESDNEDGVRDETPLLPIFSAAHLGSRTVFSDQLSLKMD